MAAVNQNFQARFLNNLRLKLVSLCLFFIFCTLFQVSAQNQAGFRSAELLGIKPGETTLADMAKNPHLVINGPKEKKGEYEIYRYKIIDMDSFATAQLLVKGERVEALIIVPSKVYKINDVRNAFQDTIEGLRSINIQDSEGNFREVYPDIGFSFIFRKDEKTPEIQTDEISQIMLEEAKAEFFLVRGYEGWRSIFSGSTIEDVRADAETVKALDPSSGSAYWLLGMTDFITQDYESSYENVLQAIRLNAKIPEFHFLLMNILEQRGAFDEGFEYAEKIRETCSETPLHKAEFDIIYATFLHKKSNPDCDKAIKSLRKVIEDLKEFSANKKKSTADLLLAKELIADAYTALGTAIAAKDWPSPEEKEKSFLWFNVGKKLLSNVMKEDPAAVIRLLDLYKTASETAYIIPGETEFGPLISDLSELADSFLKKEAASAEQGLINLKTGSIYFSAFILLNEKGNDEDAEKYALKALQYLTPCLESDPEKIEASLGCSVDYELGIFLCKRGLEKETIQRLLTRAGEKISASIKQDGSPEDGDQGIRLVNIGKVSWEAGNKEVALNMTQLGVQTVEKTVEAGNMPREQLRIPYENLISIYRAFNIKSQEEIYAEKLRSLLENGEESK